MNSRRVAHCYHCRKTFDAVTSRWCDCLTRRRSLVCPDCGKCSCGAPLDWNIRFGSLDFRPVRNAGAAQPVEAPESVSLAERPLVLIVDDQKIVHSLLFEGLSTDFRVISAVDGQEGLALARKFKPAVVVTDALMPRLDGRELCRTLKLDPATRDIKVAIMTSIYVNLRHEHEAIKTYGADAYLRKPLAAAKLKATIHALLASPREAASSAV